MKAIKSKQRIYDTPAAVTLLQQPVAIGEHLKSI
jgi:hypothetical protein